MLHTRSRIIVSSRSRIIVASRSRIIVSSKAFRASTDVNCSVTFWSCSYTVSLFVIVCTLRPKCCNAPFFSSNFSLLSSSLVFSRCKCECPMPSTSTSTYTQFSIKHQQGQDTQRKVSGGAKCLFGKPIHTTCSVRVLHMLTFSLFSLVLNIARG